MGNPQCKYCNYCIQIGRMQTQKQQIGRKKYYCDSPVVKKMKDKQGYAQNNFVGFGDSNYESSLTLKTSPRWCPLRNS